MVQNLKFKITLIIAILIGAAFVIYSKDITLGLDLSGGSSLRYKLPRPADLQAPKTMKDVLDDTLDVFRKRIQGSGLKEIPIRGSGDDEILLELPDMTEAQVNIIVDIIQSQGNLEWMISVEGIEEDDNDDTINVDVVEEQKKFVAFLQKLETDKGGWDLNVDLSPLNFKRTINGRSAVYRWAPHTDESLVKAGFEVPPEASTFESLGLDPEAAPDGVAGIGKYFTLLKRFDDVNWQFRGSDLTSVSQSFDRNQNPAVGFTLRSARAADFGEFTKTHIDKKLAIVLDGRVDSEPVIQGELPGSGVISGPQPKGFTLLEQKKLLTLLRSGSLEVKPVLLSKNTIGPTLGDNSIYRGKIAAAIGMSAVFIFLICYYLFAGMIAAISLAINLSLLLGFLVFMEATLTLPGIAGIVLTVGMAVDANILIFERIREEKDKGKTLPQSVKNGFDRAFITIVDANVTTFMTGAILYWCGTGPIKGFAATLMTGICTSLFSALFVSKVIFAFLLEKGRLKKLNMLRLLKSPDVGFTKAMPIAGTISVAVIIAGLVAFFMTDDRKYGLDFTGGYHIRLKCLADLEQKDVLDRLGTDFPNVQVVSVAATGEAPPYREFDIKIKSTLSDEEALRLEEEALQTTNSGEEVNPDEPTSESGIGSSEFYLNKIKNLMGDLILKDPVYDLKLTPDPANQTAAVTFGLNLEDPVDRPAIEAALADLITIQDVRVSPDQKSAEVSGVYTRDITILPAQLHSRIIAQVKTAELAGSPVKLLDPYPLTGYIGPTVGHQLRDAAIIAIFFSLVAIIVYIRLRFKEYKYGFAAAAALVHDVLITLGVVTAARYSGLVDIEIDLPLIAAFLTIIGYSLNDTIVVFDRVRENLPRIEMPFVKLVNLSINQTLARTILTSVTTLLTLTILFVLNYQQRNVMEGFSFALIVGVIVGTYSSIFVASPVLILLHQREERAVAAK